MFSVIFMPIHVYGALSPGIEAHSHVLHAGRRHGDVTPNINVALENQQVDYQTSMVEV